MGVRFSHGLLFIVMDNKAWFFGDSFTFGHGCKPGYKYYDTYKEKRGKLWTTEVSNFLMLPEINHGIPGNSNPYILKQILTNLQNFQKGDFVFLTDTLPVRLVHPSLESKKIEPLTTDILLWPEHNKEGQVFLDKYFTSNDKKRVVVDYIFEAINRKEEPWEEYYRLQLEGIQTFLNRLEINTYIWSHREWVSPSKYEYITKATKRKVIDGHWSWKGHKDFSEAMISRIKNKEYTKKELLI